MDKQQFLEHINWLMDNPAIYRSCKGTSAPEYWSRYTPDSSWVLDNDPQSLEPTYWELHRPIRALGVDGKAFVRLLKFKEDVPVYRSTDTCEPWEGAIVLVAEYHDDDTVEVMVVDKVSALKY